MFFEHQILGQIEFVILRCKFYQFFCTFSNEIPKSNVFAYFFVNSINELIQIDSDITQINRINYKKQYFLHI